MPPPPGRRSSSGHPVDRAAIDALDADAVVLAVDGMTAALAPELAPLGRPVRGQVLATEPLPERLFDRPHYARGGYDYWQQLPDGRLILGGRRDTSLETEQTAAEETTAVDPGSARRARRRADRPDAGRDHAPLGRHLGPDVRSAAARRPVARQRPALGRRRLLGARQRARFRLRRSGRAGDPRRAAARSSPASIPAARSAASAGRRPR